MLSRGTVLRSPAMRYVALACGLVGACAGPPRPAPDAPGSLPAAPPAELAVEPLEDSAGSVTGSVVDRVRAARIPTRIVLENVARGFGLREAHQALMDSPGHRANALSAEVTHVGIGVALGAPVSGRREIYITEIFLREAFGTDPCAGAKIAGCRTRPVAPL